MTGTTTPHQSNTYFRPGPHAGSLLTINLGAIVANYRRINTELQRLSPGTRAAGVVKADAYGLGMDHVAPALYGADCRVFFVASFDEALALRQILPDDAGIIILNGIAPGAERDCAANGLIPVLNSPKQVIAWHAHCEQAGHRFPAALQVDTGMSRLGLTHAEVDALQDRLSALNLRLVMSHLACADDPAHPQNAEQRARFDALRRRFPDVPASLANSAGVFLGADYHYDVVRPGIALYGGRVSSDPHTEMQPVFRLQAQVLQIREVPAGAAVGYGATCRVEEPCRAATISIGYADGWPRHLSNQGAAYHGDIRCPILGRVSMDSTSIDVSAVPEGQLRVGDYVDLIGPMQSAHDIAALIGTIDYEILTSLGRRHRRIYIHS